MKALIAKALYRQSRRARSRLLELAEAERLLIWRKLKRHAMACRAFRIEVDTGFLAEAIDDLLTDPDNKEILLEVEHELMNNEKHKYSEHHTIERDIRCFAELKALSAATLYALIVTKSDQYQDLCLDFMKAVEAATREDAFASIGLEDPDPDRPCFDWLEKILLDNRKLRDKLREEIVQEIVAAGAAGQTVH